MDKKEAQAALYLLTLGYMVQRPLSTAPEAPTLAQRTAAIEDRPATTAATSQDPAAPHGRDAEGTPLAPFGWLADGSRPRKTSAGRPQRAATPAAVATPVVQAGPVAFPIDLGDIGGVQAAPVAAPVVETTDSILDSLRMELGPI